jgi:hypothetical protein
MKLFATLAFLTALTACTDPQFGANIGIGSDGMSVSPSLSGQIGGAHVSITG